MAKLYPLLTINLDLCLSIADQLKYSFEKGNTSRGEGKGCLAVEPDLCVY